MFPSIAKVASVAALMAIAIPPYSAGAVWTPSLQSDDAVVLVGERERWRGGWGSRGWRGGGDHGWRFRGHDGWRFRGDDGWRASRGGPWHDFRRRRDD
jgi:uncharacterized membrane protein YgcG